MLQTIRAGFRRMFARLWIPMFMNWVSSDSRAKIFTIRIRGETLSLAEIPHDPGGFP